MNEIIFECLTEYVRCNNQHPSDLILIKNGSTKYDNKTIIDAEVGEIKEILKSFQPHISTKIIYVLLDKDTNQKFFVDRGRDIINPESGILVDAHAVKNKN